MRDNRKPSAVIAGVDGSEPAILAVKWAIEEAISRDVPLRLVYVTKATHPSAADYEHDVKHGKASLLLAQNAIAATDRPVKVETSLITGPPGAALIAESRDAAMICVGTVGIGRYARAILGSTAAELAEKAHCPVAIVRPPDDGAPRDINWIIVAVNDEPNHTAVVEQAMAEARLRRAPVLVIGDRRTTHARLEGLHREVDRWRQRYPDVHIYPVADQGDVATFLKHVDERVQLAVIGASETDQLTRIVGTGGHPVFHHAKSSVLVVRE